MKSFEIQIVATESKRCSKRADCALRRHCALGQRSEAECWEDREMSLFKVVRPMYVCILTFQTLEFNNYFYLAVLKVT